MGSRPAAEIDAWLRSGGVVVTASERAARAIGSDFHRARRAEGLAAWPAPDIQPWSAFVLTAWQERALDGRLILNSVQEQSLWAEIVAADPNASALLEGPRHRMARLAMEAHSLLCAYAPRFLAASARAVWQQDAAAFRGWLAAFDETCRTSSLLSPARLPLELLPLLENSEFGARRADRPPLLLAGFDRVQPIQREVLNAWGDWTEIELKNSDSGAPEPGPPRTGLRPWGGEPALSLPKDPAFGTWDEQKPASIHFHEARDAQSELAGCALWCGRQLAANPHARLLVIAQDASLRRGEIERAFLRYTGVPGDRSSSLGWHAGAAFEFSLGIPLAGLPLAKSALLILRWLTIPLAEHELDWLFSAGHIASQEDAAELQAVMRALRGRSLEQPEWSLSAFLAHTSASAPLPRSWVTRITQAQHGLTGHARRMQSPLEWAELVPELLKIAGWPGTRPLSSAEFQAGRRFQHALETAGSLGFNGRRIPWQDFLSALARILDETLFAPESRDAPIQIAGPAESAGLTADAIWFLGANEDAWPSTAPMHPLLPLEVQRQFAMPHAAPQLDWDLARAITARLAASAPEVNFSFARQVDDVEAHASRLIAQLAGPPQPLPTDLEAEPIPAPLTVDFRDESQIPFPPGKVPGGAAVITAQSQCPFKAFATARLAAQAWEPAQPALTPAQRGNLLHAALHAIWGGSRTGGIRTPSELQALPDRSSFVTGHVRRAFQQEIRPSLRARLPRRYLELEEQRLNSLISEWLDYESTRVSFAVLETELDRTIHLAGLTLDLRLDRLDRLADGSLLVIDYKSGNASPKSWDLPRPDDVQLPLYAGFALDDDAELGGLTFAKVRTGEPCFAGRIGDARATLRADLGPATDLVRKPFTAEQLMDWRNLIENLAHAFLAGRAEVDPRDPPKTCERCGLQTLCRVHENEPQIEAGDDSGAVGESSFPESADE
ncbi:MAG: PD-(D/E)XK nuclease family protein [Terracidiphilus sp.]